MRFFLHESEDPEDDRRRLDELIALISGAPGSHPVRLFVHAADGDQIELALPDADATEELRQAGIALLTPYGGAEPLPSAAEARAYAAARLAQLPSACQSLFPGRECWRVEVSAELECLYERVRKGVAQ